MGDVGSRFLAVYKPKRELEEFVCLSLCWIDLGIIADKENILSGKFISFVVELHCKRHSSTLCLTNLFTYRNEGPLQLLPTLNLLMKSWYSQSCFVHSHIL